MKRIWRVALFRGWALYYGALQNLTSHEHLHHKNHIRPRNMATSIESILRATTPSSNPTTWSKD